MDGRGVECNVTYGFVMIGRADELGSETACYNLGKWHRSGINGFPKDEAQARKWFRKMETREHKNCLDNFREQAGESPPCVLRSGEPRYFPSRCSIYVCVSAVAES